MTQMAGGCRREAARWAWSPSLLLGLLAIVLYWEPGLSAVLQYDRIAIADGQWWRWITGHMVHWTDDNLTLDVLMFVVLGLLVEATRRERLLPCVVLSAAAISTANWLCLSEMTYYRGLSGIDSALFVFVAIEIMRTSRRENTLFREVLGGGALAVFVAKSLYEVFTGDALFVHETTVFSPVPLAHVAGGAVGMLCALWPTSFMSAAWQRGPRDATVAAARAPVSMVP